jgi:hypothetical protein
MSNNGFPIPVKFLRSLALIIVRPALLHFPGPYNRRNESTAGKNWAQGFYKRHPELKARKVKALDWNRHDKGIYDKVTYWFEVFGKELNDLAILHV